MFRPPNQPNVVMHRTALAPTLTTETLRYIIIVEPATNIFIVHSYSFPFLSFPFIYDNLLSSPNRYTPILSSPGAYWGFCRNSGCVLQCMRGLQCKVRQQYLWDWGLAQPVASILRLEVLCKHASTRQSCNRVYPAATAAHVQVHP